MAHQLEIINGKASMAYAGAVPWHGLGKNVHNDLTPEQMLEEAGLDWIVRKVPLVGAEDPNKLKTPDFGLFRESNVKEIDGSYLTTVGKDWNVVQNHEAAEFFHEFVMRGDMEMHTAGSLAGGQIVWFQARVKEDFCVFGSRDRVEAHFLFSNFHRYGASNDLRFSAERVVCRNTQLIALSGKNDLQVKVHHRQKFDAEKVKEALGLAHNCFSDYKEAARFLAKKKFDHESVQDFFNEVFPSTAKEMDPTTHLSRNAAKAMDVLDTQPGHELGQGTWWQALNTVTYLTDHVLGNKPDTRLESSWYGANRKVKVRALDKALEFADRS